MWVEEEAPLNGFDRDIPPLVDRETAFIEDN